MPPNFGAPQSVMNPTQQMPQHHLPFPTSSPPTSDPLMDSTWDSPSNLLDFLLKAENKIKSLRESVIKETGQFEYAAKQDTVSWGFYFPKSESMLFSMNPYQTSSAMVEMQLCKTSSTVCIVNCCSSLNGPNPSSPSPTYPRVIKWRY